VKANKTRKGMQYQTTGEERQESKRVALLQQHAIKPLNKKNNSMTRIISTYILTLTQNVNRLNSPIKRHHLATGLKKKIQQSVAYRRPISLAETSTGLG
jgi:hypothetical protein